MIKYLRIRGTLYYIILRVRPRVSINTFYMIILQVQYVSYHVTYNDTHWVRVI